MKIIKKFIRFLDNNIGMIEGFLFFYFIMDFAKNSKEDTTFLLLIIPIYILFVNIKYKIKVHASKKNLKYIIKNKRTIKTSGEQGGGKTSILGYMASVSGRPIYSLTPMKINGEYCNILTYEHLILKKKIEDNAILLIDEFTLIFSNTQQGNNDKSLQADIHAFEILIQLIRHFFNGSLWYASVDTDRALKVLREKVMFRNQMLGQDTIKNSWVIAPIINMLSKWKWHGYFRTWSMQTYEHIEEDGYIFDLSTDTQNTKNNRFANLLEIVSYDNKDFEYNDRYLKALYDALDIPYEKKQFTSLDMDIETVKTQYEKIYKFLLTNRNLNASKLEVDK